MADWRDYVRTVVTRYKGRISAYEVGNEPGYKRFFNGTPAEMAEMTRIAAEEIRRADPAAKIVSPGITVNGLAWLDQYLTSGTTRPARNSLTLTPAPLLVESTG